MSYILFAAYVLLPVWFSLIAATKNKRSETVSRSNAKRRHKDGVEVMVYPEIDHNLLADLIVLREPQAVFGLSLEFGKWLVMNKRMNVKQFGALLVLFRQLVQADGRYWDHSTVQNAYILIAGRFWKPPCGCS